MDLVNTIQINYIKGSGKVHVIGQFDSLLSRKKLEAVEPSSFQFLL